MTVFIVFESTYLLKPADIRRSCLYDRPNCWGSILGPYL